MDWQDELDNADPVLIVWCGEIGQRFVAACADKFMCDRICELLNRYGWADIPDDARELTDR